MNNEHRRYKYFSIEGECYGETAAGTSIIYEIKGLAEVVDEEEAWDTHQVHYGYSTRKMIRVFNDEVLQPILKEDYFYSIIPEKETFDFDRLPQPYLMRVDRSGDSVKIQRANFYSSLVKDIDDICQSKLILGCRIKIDMLSAKIHKSRFNDSMILSNDDFEKASHTYSDLIMKEKYLITAYKKAGEELNRQKFNTGDLKLEMYMVEEGVFIRWNRERMERKIQLKGYRREGSFLEEDYKDSEDPDSTLILSSYDGHGSIIDGNVKSGITYYYTFYLTWLNELKNTFLKTAQPDQQWNSYPKRLTFRIPDSNILKIQQALELEKVEKTLEQAKQRPLSLEEEEGQRIKEKIDRTWVRLRAMKDIVKAKIEAQKACNKYIEEIRTNPDMTDQQKEFQVMQIRSAYQVIISEL